MTREIEYTEVTDFIDNAGQTMIPGLLARCVRAAVRLGCFKDDEAMYRAMDVHAKDEREKLENV